MQRPISTSGFSIQTAGLIVMLIGIVGLAISLLFLTAWSDRRRGTVAGESYVADPTVVRERDVL